jgi:hypothetical protein
MWYWTVAICCLGLAMGSFGLWCCLIGALVMLAVAIVQAVMGGWIEAFCSFVGYDAAVGVALWAAMLRQARSRRQ